MSFEGYYQILCKKGHYTEEDCYSAFSVDKDSWYCPHCANHCAWWNLVDITNGSFDPETNERIDGHVALETDEPIRAHTCPCCGQQVIKEQPTFKVPQFLGHRGL